MIVGECPYPDCEHPLMICLPPKVPCYSPHTCEGCQRTIWTRFSRIDPQSWTEADFLAEFDVNESTKTIKERVKPE